MKARISLLILLALFTMVLFCSAARGSLVISTTTAAALGGLAFDEDDLAVYDPVTALGTATSYFDGNGSSFTLIENIDAAHHLPNNHMVLSTQNDATLGVTLLTFQEDDLVDYDPATDTATLLFDGDGMFTGAANIDAVHVLANGHYVFSTDSSETLVLPGGNLSFKDGDLVEYDPSNQTATIIFYEDDEFKLSEDIDAVHVLGDNNFILSTQNGATIGKLDGELTFRDGDLVLYNSVTNVATLFFDEDWFTTSAENIDAVTTPEPGTLGLFLLGFALIGKRRL